MIFLLIYFVTGIITARFFERRHYRVAVTTHAIMFTVLLFFVLITRNDLAISAFMMDVLITENKADYQELFMGDTITVLEIALIILSIFTALISVWSIMAVSPIRKVKAWLIHGLRRKIHGKFGRLKNNFSKRPLFRMNCRMNT